MELITASQIRAVALAAALFTFGCGDDGGGGTIDAAGPPDAAGPDAGFNEAACPTSWGPASVGSTFSVPDTDVGFDLDGDTDVDGDGEIDNALGAIGFLINNSFQNNINDGSLRTITELRELDALGTDDSSVDVVLYNGVDGDTPANTDDDFAGDEDYYVERTWLEPADCSPVAVIPSSYTGGAVSGSADRTTFFVGSLGGFVEFRKARLEATVEADTAGTKTPQDTPAMFGGVIPGCSLNQAAGSIGDSAQEDVTRLGNVQPDIDLDGDGLETVRADGGGIIDCTDGDGTTVIEGPECGCDPRMADGYSITFLIDLVGASIIGPEPM